MSAPQSPLTRRDFLATGAKLGAFLAAAPYISRAADAGSAKSDQLNVALIGCGEQGRVLLNAALKIPDIRFKAVCDIWSYNRTYGERLLKKFGHDVKPYEDYHDLLAAHPELDAVLIATPDFKHSEHTTTALKAGKHVYCEKLMSNTVEGARAMVVAARETKKLLQIGHQRRSNPRYLHARDKIVRGAKLLGRVTTITGQWHRAVTDDFGFPKGQEIPEAKRNQYGFANMHEFRNWRWFKKYAGGPISDLGAHQIDVYNWMLGVNPRMCLATGGVDYYTTHEWYDNVFALFEYPTSEGIVRAEYNVLTTTSAGGGYHEYFMGDLGAMKISENPAYTKIYREARAPEWEPFAAQGIIGSPLSGEGAPPPVKPWEKEGVKKLAAPSNATVDVRETAALSAWEIPVTLDKAIHQPHLENFFDAIRHGTPLNCPGESAFATAVTILKINEAVAAQKLLTYAPGDFTA